MRYGRWGGADGKVRIERGYLSPYVEKPFNSKVIKSFVPELRSRECFSCFGIPMFYVYMLRTFYVHFTYSCIAMLQLVDSSQVKFNWFWAQEVFHKRFHLILRKSFLVQSRLKRTKKEEITCCKTRWMWIRTDQPKSNIFPYDSCVI